MKKLLFILTVTVFPICGFANFQITDFGETVAVGNKFYHEVKIVSISEGIATLSTHEGTVKIPWTALPVDFQKRHAADVEKLAKQQAAKAEYDAGIRELEIKVIQNVKGGVLAGKTVNIFTGETKTIFVEGLSDVADGTQLSVKAKLDGLYHYLNTGGANSTVEKWVLIAPK